MPVPVYRLEAKTQSYDWGKLGNESKVALYATQSGVEVDPTKPYAELWMGTHPNAPSIVKDDQTPLKDLVQAKPELSTEEVYKQYDGDLPFLFKILSIRKALSIQAHPDKELGARLHKEFPNMYKDPNHKPEMAIALTPFEALCGFRPLEEIQQHMEQYPEFVELIGTEVSQEFSATIQHGEEEKKKDALRAVFSALMHSPQERVTEQLSKLTGRLRQEKKDDPLHELILRLDQQYPGGDVGVFSVLLLNYIVLKPSEAIYLGANEPHAYLSGDCVECMAASDNVIRAGLTPKFKDVKVLVDMLTYRYGRIDSKDINMYHWGASTVVYNPPIDEFSVMRTRLNAGENDEHRPVAGPSILIVTAGNGSLRAELDNTTSDFLLETGYVYFIGANVQLTLTAGDKELELYRAFTSIPDLQQ